MKAVILAGGLGTRISEETHLKPKPMIDIGSHPILCHIMKVYASHGVYDFIICCGYKGYLIKEYFANYFLHTSDVTFNLADNQIEVHQKKVEPWTVTLVDTVQYTQTARRLRRVAQYLKNEPAFCFTHGDGIGDIDVSASINFHLEHGKLATVTAVQPPGRFGVPVRDNSKVTGFYEKPPGDGAWINGGFFVLHPDVITYIHSDDNSWETDTMVALANDGQLQSYEHNGFWRPMDTLREKIMLNELWSSNNAPWKCWD